MSDSDVLLFSRGEVRKLLSLAECIDAVERGLAALGRGEAASPPSSTGVALEDVAAAILVYERGREAGAVRFSFDA